jgi:hypothetical protein
VLLLKAAVSGVRAIKTFGASGLVPRITLIWWGFVTCLAASLVAAEPTPTEGDPP